MASAAQRRASASYRKRASARGLVRVEVQVPALDASLMRDIASRLREKGVRSRSTRARLRESLDACTGGDVLSMFNSDLPDEYFEGVFETRLRDRPRDIDL